MISVEQIGYIGILGVAALLAFLFFIMFYDKLKRIIITRARVEMSHQMVRNDLIDSLEEKELEKLLSWGIQRQLRWAVFTVTLLIALLTLFIKINEKLLPSMASIPPIFKDSNNAENIWLMILLVLVFVGALFCLGQVVEYYQYVAGIEESLIKKKQKNSWTDAVSKLDIKKLKREDVFIVNSMLERWLNNPKSKRNLRLTAIVIALLVFLGSRIIDLIVGLS